MKTYHYLTGGVFAVVALVHLLRIINHWPLILGSWDAPMYASWLGLMVAGFLCIWSFRLLRV
jgi:hypothetical protein